MDMKRDDCSICIEPIEAEDYYDTSCSHCFHKLCIVTWLVKANTCPYCRTVLEHVFVTENGKRRQINLVILLQEKKEEKCRDLLNESNEGINELLKYLGEALQAHSSLLVVRDAEPRFGIERLDDTLEKLFERMAQLRALREEHDDEINELMETYRDSEIIGLCIILLKNIFLEFALISYIFDNLNETCGMAQLKFQSQQGEYTDSVILDNICEEVKSCEQVTEVCMQILRGCILTRGSPLKLNHTTLNIIFRCFMVDLCICCNEKLQEEAPNTKIDGCGHSLCIKCCTEDIRPGVIIHCPCQES